VRNATAVLALLVSLLAVGIFVGAGLTARMLPEVSWLEAFAAVPAAGLLAVFALSLAARGRAAHQRTLGRVGGEGVARAARGLGLVALLLTVSGALALGVFAVLVSTDGLTHAPW
jgi:hypothetical protein